VRFDTPAGLVTCEVAIKDGRTKGVSFTNVDSFLLLREAEIAVEGLGRLAVDVAYGGDFYAVVDADALDLDLDVANEAALIAAARVIRPAVEAQLDVRHPERADIDHCYMVQFISKKTGSGGDLRNTVVAPPGTLDRSPCGTGTSAQVARLVTLGELEPAQRLRLEGPLGTFFDGEAVTTQQRGDHFYVTPRVTGRAYITGLHQFVLEPDDPFPAGYRVGSQV
jgi:proline racemase